MDVWGGILSAGGDRDASAESAAASGTSDCASVAGTGTATHAVHSFGAAPDGASGGAPLIPDRPWRAGAYHENAAN
jgi:hypothetical protein